MSQPAAAPTPLLAQRLVFDGKQQVRLEATALPVPQAGEVRIASEYSLMSTGTENIVFNRLFDAGTGWDNWVKYPFFPGYSLVGRIDAVGPDVTAFTIGQRVTARKPHGSHHLARTDEIVAVPERLDPKLAAWFALAKITYGGCRVAEFHVGDSALVIGAGPIGQMSLRWAFASGVRDLIVVDALESRLQLARAGGATITIAAPIEQAKERIQAALGGRLPRVVIDTTGNAAVFAHATTLAADRGRIVIVGDTGSPTNQHLTGDVLGRGLSIVAAHDTHWPGNPESIVGMCFDLALSGRFPLDGLNTHSFKPAAAAEAYHIANTKRGETMGILFDWT